MSEKSLVFKVRKEKKVPIPVIEDDYRAVKKDITRKMSDLTLKYLKDADLVKGFHYAVYKVVSENPEYRTSISEKNVIEHLNQKLIDHYETA